MTVSPPPATETRTLNTLQIGKSWFPEQKGSGLDRMYHGLYHSLPNVGVNFYGVVAGRNVEAKDHRGSVHPFASDHASLPKRLVGARSAIRAAIQQEPFDLVASHFALYTAPALDLLDDLPIIVHFHGPWAHESAVEGGNQFAVRAKQVLESMVYRRGARFIVLSEAFRDVLCSEYGIDASAVRIVPGGVNASHFDTGYSRMAAREHLDWPTDRPILLTIRRLAHRMGLEHLIDALERVRQRVPDVLLLIGGSGPLASQLKTQIDAAGLQNHVRLLGFVPEDELPLAYRAANVSIVPTTALEGFGLTTVESLAAGTPVLVSPRGGLPEVVRDLSDDLIFSTPAPAPIADRLIAVLTGTIQLPSLKACQHYVRTRFDWPVIAAQTRQVYEEST